MTRLALSAALSGGAVIFARAVFNFPDRSFTDFFSAAFVTLVFYGLYRLCAFIHREYKGRGLAGIIGGVFVIALFAFTGGFFDWIRESAEYYADFIANFNLMRPSYDEGGEFLTVLIVLLATGVINLFFVSAKPRAGVPLALYGGALCVPFKNAEPGLYGEAAAIFAACLLALCVLRVPGALSARLRVAVNPRYAYIAGLPLAAVIFAAALFMPRSNERLTLPDFPQLPEFNFTGLFPGRGSGGFGSGAGSGYGSGSVYTADSPETVRLGGPNNSGGGELFTVKANAPWYLYTAEYDDYDGASWSSNREARAFLNDPEDEGEEELTIKFTNTSSYTLPMPGNVKRVLLPDGYGMPYRWGQTSFRVDTRAERGFEYKVRATRADYREIYENFLETQSARTDYLGEYTTTQRVGELARQIYEDMPGERRDAFAYADALESYLAANFEYDLNAPELPPGRDFADFFLFDAKRGYCTSFATAMTVMLRDMGIPARYCSGFIPSESTKRNGVYSVSGRDAHAWVEAFLGGNWVVFDPTPSAPASTMREARRPAVKESAVPAPAPPSAALPSDEFAPVIPTAAPAAPKETKTFKLPAFLWVIPVLLLFAGCVYLRVKLRARAAAAISAKPPGERLRMWFPIYERLFSVMKIYPRRGETLTGWSGRIEYALPSTHTLLVPFLDACRTEFYDPAGYSGELDPAELYAVLSEFVFIDRKYTRVWEIVVTGRAVRTRRAGSRKIGVDFSEYL